MAEIEGVWGYLGGSLSASTFSVTPSMTKYSHCHRKTPSSCEVEHLKSPREHRHCCNAVLSSLNLLSMVNPRSVRSQGSCRTEIVSPYADLITEHGSEQRVSFRATLFLACMPYACARSDAACGVNPPRVIRICPTSTVRPPAFLGRDKLVIRRRLNDGKELIVE